MIGTSSLTTWEKFLKSCKYRFHFHDNIFHFLATWQFPIKAIQNFLVNKFVYMNQMEETEKPKWFPRPFSNFGDMDFGFWVTVIIIFFELRHSFSWHRGTASKFLSPLAWGFWGLINIAFKNLSFVPNTTTYLFLCFLHCIYLDSYQALPLPIS